MSELRTIPRRDLPRAVEEIEHFTIPLDDGTHLAARRWQPVGAEQDPVAAALEYLPYRKRDRTAYRDGLNHPYMAGHGYVRVRVDLRGSGDSEGVLTDEYLPRELDDGMQVLAWIAPQPWCDGRVGIIGKSWGASTACRWLRVARRRWARSCRCARPTTASPTTCTPWVGAC